MARAKELGFEKIELGVSASNTAASALYRKIGFVEEGCRRRNRRFDAHRDWMIRSYIVTFGFVTFRYVVNFQVFNGLGRSKLAAVGWMCWVVPLLIAEIFLHWKSVAPRKGRVAGQTIKATSFAD